MPNTFGGEWHRPRDDGRGRSRRELENRASFDNQPATGCSGCLLIATICITASAAMARKGRGR
jgi:hypothetical protein